MSLTQGLQPGPGPTTRPAPSPEFAKIARIAAETAGIVLPPDKAPMVFSRIAKRLKALRLPDAQAYCSYLDSGQDPGELDRLISVLTTNVTSFFREKHHFDYLSEHVLPGLAQRSASGGRVRLWSAGCSSGEEPITLAITLLEHSEAFASGDVRILATDIDTQILDRARSARYPDLPDPPFDPVRRKRFFEPVDANDPDAGWQTRALLRDKIAFRPLNLMGPWPFKGPFDVIFCRNVAIYFSHETQATLWRRLRDMLAPGGHLFIGHSERVENAAALGMETAHTTTYRLR